MLSVTCYLLLATFHLLSATWYLLLAICYLISGAFIMKVAITCSFRSLLYISSFLISVPRYMWVGGRGWSQYLVSVPLIFNVSHFSWQYWHFGHSRHFNWLYSIYISYWRHFQETGNKLNFCQQNYEFSTTINNFDFYTTTVSNLDLSYLMAYHYYCSLSNNDLEATNFHIFVAKL